MNQPDRPARDAVYAELMWPERNPTSESYGTGAEKANALLDALEAEVRATVPAVQSPADRAAVAITEVRRLCELTIKASVRVQAIDQARDTLTLIDRIMSGPPPATDNEGLSGPCDCGEGAVHYTAAECPAELRRLAGEQHTHSEAASDRAAIERAFAERLAAELAGCCTECDACIEIAQHLAGKDEPAAEERKQPPMDPVHILGIDGEPAPVAEPPAAADDEAVRRG